MDTKSHRPNGREYKHQHHRQHRHAHGVHAPLSVLCLYPIPFPPPSPLPRTRRGPPYMHRRPHNLCNPPQHSKAHTPLRIAYLSLPLRFWVGRIHSIWRTRQATGYNLQATTYRLHPEPLAVDGTCRSCSAVCVSYRRVLSTTTVNASQHRSRPATPRANGRVHV